MLRTLILPLLLMPVLAAADDDSSFFWTNGVAAVNNDLYRSNCAECHFAYQPGLLPSRSWQKLMLPQSLENHFGDNAEVDEETRKVLRAYLVKNAAEFSDYKRSKKMIRSIAKNDTPLRITQVSYFKRKHDEIPSRMVTGNAKVKSWANCAACHTAADQGSFREHEVLIPNYGKWED